MPLPPPPPPHPLSYRLIFLLPQSRYIGPENLFSRITDEKEAARIDKKYHRNHILLFLYFARNPVIAVLLFTKWKQLPYKITENQLRNLLFYFYFWLHVILIVILAIGLLCMICDYHGAWYVIIMVHDMWFSCHLVLLTIW